MSKNRQYQRMARSRTWNSSRYKTAKDAHNESIARKLDGQIIYDSQLDDFNEWLNNNLPSMLMREDHIGKIIVEASQDDDPCDYELLQNGWKELTESGKKINYMSICKLAKESNNLRGKWILHVSTGYKVDIIWGKIATAMINGALKNVALRAKVSPRYSEEDYHIITIHNEDYTNESSVLALNSALREVGVKARLFYKPNIYTHLGIFRNNEWKIRPSIYESIYDVLKKESMVTPLYNKAYDPSEI